VLAKRLHEVDSVKYEELEWPALRRATRR
jgi:hypothetical protein